MLSFVPLLGGEHSAPPLRVAARWKSSENILIVAVYLREMAFKESI